MRNLKAGTWVTLERMRVYSLILLAFWLCAIVAVTVTSQGGIDFMGRPLGTDFSGVWSAGRLVLDGKATTPYNPSLHYLVQQRAFDNSDIPCFGWHYPPFFLFIAAALAALPYGWALGVWVFATLPLYLAAVRNIVSFPLAMLVAAAYPAVAINVMHGQNGFLSAALLGIGLVFLDRRPVFAGIAFGLLTYKPQFVVLIPLVLFATRRWRVFGVTSLTVMALAVFSTLAFGPEIWRAFYVSTGITREIVLEAGALSWYKLQSVFAALRLLGAPVSLAYTAQGILAVIVTATTLWLWRKPLNLALKSAGLVTAVLLVTPYVLDYDLVILGLGIAWMVSHGMKHGFLPWEKSALVVVWAMPLVSRMAAQGLSLPLGLIIMVMFFVLIVRRARHDLRLIDS